jgi:formylglycine-generating enzyme required for sulfatase activity
LPFDQRTGIKVDLTLRVEDQSDIWAIGDCAAVPDARGNRASLLDPYGWHTGNAAGNDPPVGAKKPNPWGLYDIHGNVAELVMDQYIEDHYAQFEGKTVHWLDALAWPTDAFPIVVRAGSRLSQIRFRRGARRLAAAHPSDGDGSRV